MPTPKDPTLETIDPTALATVNGGKASASDDGSAAIMTALTGILDSIKSMATSNSSSGFGPQEMMLMMMMMGGRNSGQVVAAAPQPTNWTWDATNGYWIVQ